MSNLIILISLLIIMINVIAYVFYKKICYFLVFIVTHLCNIGIAYSENSIKEILSSNLRAYSYKRHLQVNAVILYERA